MELATRTIDFQRNIWSGFFIIRLYRWSNLFVTPLLAENLHAYAFSNSAQQVQSFYAHVVINNRDGFLRHSINLRVGDVGFQFLTPSASASALGPFFI